MADLQTDNEGENDAEEEKPPAEKPPRSDNRFKDLSEKVELTAKERDEATAKATALEKENEFYKGFSKVSSKYEGAADHQDKILEKYTAGYDLEDATISVLAKAGKLQNAPTRQSPAGGSASTAIQAGDDKPISEMTRAEKRAALEEQDRLEPGSLSKILRNTNVG